MPELPEVESIKKFLKPRITGKRIKKITVFSEKNFIGSKIEAIGKKITGLKRYGKVLVFELENKKYLNIHFKLSGQMLFAADMEKASFASDIPFTGKKTMPGRTTRVTISFQDNSGLFFNDLRKFGWIKLTSHPLRPKGIDVLSKKFTFAYIKKIFKSLRPIKTVLMDQDRITGIGNIYANDSLFKSRISPLRKAGSLNDFEIHALHRSIIHEIKKGVKDKGSSGADEAYILPDGSKGKHQRRFLVYQKEGSPCLRCKTKIKRVKQAGRSSFFCPKCQSL